MSLVIDIERLTPALWNNYVGEPTQDNLIACLMVSVISWDFKGDPFDKDSYAKLSDDEFTAIKEKFGAEIVAYNNRRAEAFAKRRAKKKPKKRLKKSKK